MGPALDGRQQVATAEAPPGSGRRLQHFAHLAPAAIDELFAVVPLAVTRDAPLDDLAAALGATLYLPATRPRLADDLLRLRGRGVLSAVVCLEDSVASRDLAAAETNLVAALVRIAAAPDPGLPLVHLRPRSPEQLVDLVRRLGAAAALLDGFALPKFDAPHAGRWFDAVAAAETVAGRRLSVMPILETAPVMHLETRARRLAAIRRVLDAHRDRVLAVRIGATDLSALYALRRRADLTVWDVGVVAGLIADVVNVLGRADGTGHVITGPVWEHLPARASAGAPGAGPTGGLVREVVLDAANGLRGKTVIHPAHVPVVHAASVVPAEDHADACDLLADDDGGASSSRRGDRMNESGPHRAWAERTLRTARAFGVARPGVGLEDLLAAPAVP